MTRPPIQIEPPTSRDNQISLPAMPDFPGAIPVCDPSTLSELEGVLGHVRLMELLSHLKDEIALRLLTPAVNRTALRNDAHALLSVSGSLGFFELSRRCIEMDQACRLDADLVAPLDAVRAAAEGAVVAIDDIIAAWSNRCRPSAPPDSIGSVAVEGIESSTRDQTTTSRRNFGFGRSDHRTACDPARHLP